MICIIEKLLISTLIKFGNKTEDLPIREIKESHLVRKQQPAHIRGWYTQTKIFLYKNKYRPSGSAVCRLTVLCVLATDLRLGLVWLGIQNTKTKQERPAEKSRCRRRSCSILFIHANRIIIAIGYRPGRPALAGRVIISPGGCAGR